jgi:hypothetical protein
VQTLSDAYPTPPVRATDGAVGYAKVCASHVCTTYRSSPPSYHARHIPVLCLPAGLRRSMPVGHQLGLQEHAARMQEKVQSGEAACARLRRHRGRATAGGAAWAPGRGAGRGKRAHIIYSSYVERRSSVLSYRRVFPSYRKCSFFSDRHPNPNPLANHTNPNPNPNPNPNLAR